MMAQTELDDYCRRLKLPQSGIGCLNNVANSDPARRVRSNGGNATVRYPSQKNGFVVQAESRTVELPFIYTLEYDEEVRAYYDQPTTFTLSYIAKSGRRTGALHTPDFLVLHNDRVEIVETKTEDELLRLSEGMPNRYQRSAGGKWVCPPGEEVARGYGFQYRVVSSAELAPTFTRNITFMADYLDERVPEIDSCVKQRLTNVIGKNVGISIKQLLDLCTGTKPEEIYALIGRRHAFVDLRQAAIVDWERTLVFGSPELASACRVLSEVSKPAPSSSSMLVAVGTELLWHDRRYIIANYNAALLVLTTDGRTVQIDRDVFDAAVTRGEIVQFGNPTPTSLTNPELTQAALAASPEDLAIALRRFNALRTGDPKAAGVTSRTFDRWKKDSREAEEIRGSGAGLLALLPKAKFRGNRTRRFSPDVYALADKIIAEDFLTFKQMGRLPIYARFREACVTAGYSTPSYQWFCNRIRHLDRYEATKARRGKRAAYPFEPRHEPIGPPRTCDRPFERVHIDHTQLDIQLISSTTGKHIGRPWLTLAIDECTRRVLAYYLTFDSPSFKSCMAALREIVRVHNRLPDRVIVDNGKEFSSCDFELLAARYEMAIEKRPPAKPRFGSTIERLIGTINSQLLYQLWGNTQATKTDVRTVTKSNDPERLACWTLPEFDKLFSGYIYQVYDSAVHSGLGTSPAEAFVKVLQKTGHRPTRIIPYDEGFEIWCLPSTRTGLAKVIPRAGIKVNYLYYWNETFRSSAVEGKKVRVKVDPFNAGVVYALVKNQWVRCISEHFFHGRSLKEIKIASEELRKLKSGAAANKLISAKRLRDFMAGPEEMERMKQQRQRDKERQLVSGAAQSTAADLENVMPFPTRAILEETVADSTGGHKHIEESIEI